MATRISKATGNWTATGTWANSLTILNAEQIAPFPVSGGGQTLFALTTSVQALSTEWTAAGSEVVDAICFEVASWTGTGTLTVALHRVVGGVSDVKTLVLDVVDLPTNGWVCALFASSHTTAAADTYQMGLTLSSGTMSVVSFSGTAATMNRLFRTTTTGVVPAATENFLICGEYTGQAGTQPANTYAVTMDNTTASINLARGCVAKGGTLTWSTNIAATMQIVGNLDIQDGGIKTMGTSSGRVASGSSATLILNPSADGATGLIVRNGGTLTAYGNNIAFDRTLLNLAAGLAASGTSITSADSTGWVNADTLAIAATLRATTSPGTSEGLNPSSSSGTTITVAAHTTQHAGASPNQAEIINITRNVVIRCLAAVVPAPAAGVNPTPPQSNIVVAKVLLRPTSIVDLDYVEINGISDVTTDERGIQIETTTGSCRVNRCAIHSGEDEGIYITGPTTNNITFTNNVMFNLASVTASSFTIANATSGTAIVVTGNIFMQRLNTTAGSGSCVFLNDIGINFSNNVIVGGYYGLRMNEATSIPGTFDLNTIHNCARAGIIFQTGCNNLTISNTKIYRCGQWGVFYGPDSPAIGTLGSIFYNHLYDTVEIFGCPFNLALGFEYNCSKFLFTACNFHGSTNQGAANDTAAASTDGFQVNGNHTGFIFVSCNFGTSATGKTTHTTGDFVIAANAFFQALLENCSLASGTEISGAANLLPGSYIRMQKHDATAATHKTQFGTGVVALESTIFHTAAPCESLTPSSTTRLESGSKLVAVASGQTVVPKVWVRKSSANGTGGTRPRIRLKRNVAIGISNDVTIGTEMTDASPTTTWEQVNSAGSATAAATDDGVMEFVVDAGNANGIIYVDDWTAS
jgi:hypothetical protein